MKIYFANYGDDVLRAYKTAQARIDAINENINIADDEVGREERLRNIDQYEFDLEEVKDDENLVFERRACEEAQIMIDIDVVKDM